MLGKKHFVNRGIRTANSFLNLFGNWWTVNNNELTPILKKQLLFSSHKKIRLLHNGFVPADRINYHPDQITEFDLDKGENFVFSVVGRLQPVKNYGLFLRAAKEIAMEYENVRFWVVGNGEEYERLTVLSQELNLSDKVRFWGYRTDIDDIVYRCDAFVQTSFTEGSPNTIAEAMRAGKPIISTRSTDLSEMIEEDVNGYVVPSNDLDALVGAMKTLLRKSENERKEMGNASKVLFEKTFLDTKVAEEFNKFYKEILK